MKKLTAILMAMMMVFAFAACGTSTEEPEPETTEAVQTNHEVSGIVDDLTDGNLSIYTQAEQNLTFNIENAAINAETNISKGDIATVEYSGEISGGDTSGCQVISVTSMPGGETIIEGKVESINNDGTVTISSNSKKYTFKAEDVSKSGSVKTGETVRIAYTGVIDGDDTSHAYVKSMEVAKSTESTETTSDSVTVKAVDETVWAAANVNVRAEASATSDKIATVKKGQKLTRTGVLSNGWSRVKYKDKDRFIASSYLTTKAPKQAETKTKASETKATETKATESKTKATESKTKATESQTKATETKATETKTESKTESITETKETESVTESSEETVTQSSEETVTETSEETVTETSEETEPPTVTARGTVTETGSNSLTLDNGETYNVKGADLDISADEAVGMEVVVEYYDGTHDAVHVYPVNGSKSLDSDSSASLGGVTPIAIVIALIAIAIAAIIVFVRNRRKPEAK